MPRLFPRLYGWAGTALMWVVVLVGCAAVWAAYTGVAAYRDARYANQLTDAIRQINTRLADAEASVKDYLLTGDAGMLLPYNEAQRTSGATADQLRDLAAPAVVSTGRTDSLAYFYRLRLAELGEAVRNRSSDEALFTFDPAPLSGSVLEFRRLSESIALDITRNTSSGIRALRTQRVVVIVGVLVVIGLAVGLLRLSRAAFRHQARQHEETREALELQSFEFSQQAAELASTNTELESATREMVQQTVESEANRLQLAGILGSVMDALISYDDAHRIVYYNAAAERMFGAPVQDVTGTPVTRFLRPSPEELEQFDERMGVIRLARHVPLGAAHRWESVLRRQNGEEFPADVSVSYARAGMQGLFTAIVRDVTEQRRLEHQVRQAQKMEAVGRLAGGIAHDFNNLLTVIGASSDFLLQMRPESSDDIQEDVLEIRRATDRAAALTRQLLTFSRRQRVEPELLDLNVVVQEMEMMLQRLIGENIFLEIRYAAEPQLAYIDQGQLEQVIVNLAVNGRDAMPDAGTLTITVGPATEPMVLPGDRSSDASRPPARSYVTLSVKDTGVGMDPEVQSQIFEPFFTTKELGKGTGLGLPTVYGIVTQAEGNVVVDSVLGKGSEFTLYLPRAEDDEVISPASAQATDSLRGSETILIAEDEEALRRLARRILESRGYTVLEAVNGYDAIQVMAKHGSRVDLLVSDVVMPTMGGRELVERLLFIYPMLRVLFMSGYNEDTILQHRVTELASSVLEKPFTPESLAKAVRAALDQDDKRFHEQAPIASTG